MRDVMAETEAVAAKLGHRAADLDRSAHGGRGEGRARTRRRCCRTSRRAVRWSSKRSSARSWSWVSGSACRCRRRAPSTPARSCWTNIAEAARAARSRRRLHSEHQQSLVSARRVADRDDHDREPAVRVDAVRQADADGTGWKLSDIQWRVHAVHPVSDVGPAARGLADRPPRSALVHQRGRPAVRPRLGRAGLRHDRCRCSTRCTAWPASARRSSTAARSGRR